MDIFSCLLFLVVSHLIELGLTFSSPEPPKKTYASPSSTARDTYLSVRKGLAAASLEESTEFSANQTLEKSWSGATLLSMKTSRENKHNKHKDLSAWTSLEVICTTCYVKGLMKVQLQIDDNFNASQAVESTQASFSENLRNPTDSFEGYLANYTLGVLAKIRDGIDRSDFSLPTFPFAFDLEVPAILESIVTVQFDDVELYIELGIVLATGAAYEINLYTSLSPVGIKVGPILQFGVIAVVDLILSVETMGKIDISSGFHIKLDDGVEFNVALFGNKVSNMVFIESADVVIEAVLRIAIHCGIQVGPKDSPGGLPRGGPQIQAGVEMAVIAHVAEFVTSITQTPDDKDCKLKVVQEYSLALGAVAGASMEADFPAIGISSQTYGLVVEKSTAIFTTMLAQVCAISKSQNTAEAIMTIAAEKRQDLTTTTLSSEIITNGVSCLLTGAKNCPVSKQKTTKVTYTSYHTIAVTSGAKPTFPDPTSNIIQNRSPFGHLAKTIKASSGTPVAYTAPSTPTNHYSAHGSKKRMIIGLSIGLGLPLLAAIVGGFILMHRRKKYNA